MGPGADFPIFPGIRWATAMASWLASKGTPRTHGDSFLTVGITRDCNNLRRLDADGDIDYVGYGLLSAMTVVYFHRLLIENFREVFRDRNGVIR